MTWFSATCFEKQRPVRASREFLLAIESDGTRILSPINRVRKSHAFLLGDVYHFGVWLIYSFIWRHDGSAPPALQSNAPSRKRMHSFFGGFLFFLFVFFLLFRCVPFFLVELRPASDWLETKRPLAPRLSAAGAEIFLPVGQVNEEVARCGRCQIKPILTDTDWLRTATR